MVRAAQIGVSNEALLERFNHEQRKVPTIPIMDWRMPSPERCRGWDVHPTNLAMR